MSFDEVLNEFSMDTRDSRQLQGSPYISSTTISPLADSAVRPKSRGGGLTGLRAAAMRGAKATRPSVHPAGTPAQDASNSAPLKRRRIRADEESASQPAASWLSSPFPSPLSASSADSYSAQSFARAGNVEQFRGDAPRSILVKSRDGGAETMEGRTDESAGRPRGSAGRSKKRVSVQAESPERMFYETCTSSEGEKETKENRPSRGHLSRPGHEEKGEGGRTEAKDTRVPASGNSRTIESLLLQETAHCTSDGSRTSSSGASSRPHWGLETYTTDGEREEEPDSPALAKRVPRSFPLSDVDLPVRAHTVEAPSSAFERTVQTPWCSASLSSRGDSASSSTGDPVISACYRARTEGTLHFVPPLLRQSVASCLRRFGPERRPQLLRICSLLGDLTSPVPVIEVVGLPGTGKTSLLLSFFSSSSLTWGYVDCVSSALSVAGGGRLAVRQAVCGRLLLSLTRRLRREVHASLKVLQAAKRRLEKTMKEEQEEDWRMGDAGEDGARTGEDRTQSPGPRAHDRVVMRKADSLGEGQNTSQSDREEAYEGNSELSRSCLLQRRYGKNVGPALSRVSDPSSGVAGFHVEDVGESSRSSSLPSPSPLLHAQTARLRFPSYSVLFSDSAVAFLISDLTEKKQELEKFWRSLRAGKRSATGTQLSSVERFISALRQLLRCSSPLCRDRSVALVIDEVSFLAQNMPDLLHALLRLPELLGGEAGCYQESVDDGDTRQLGCSEEFHAEQDPAPESPFFSPSPLHTTRKEPFFLTARDRTKTEEETTLLPDSRSPQLTPHSPARGEREFGADDRERRLDDLVALSAAGGRGGFSADATAHPGDPGADVLKGERSALERKLLVQPRREVCVLLIGHAPLRDEIHLGMPIPPRVVFGAYTASEAGNVLTREFEALGLDMLQLAAIQQQRQDKSSELLRRAEGGVVSKRGCLSERLRLEEQVILTRERPNETDIAAGDARESQACFPASSTSADRMVRTRRLVLRRVRRRLRRRAGTQGWTSSATRLGRDTASRGAACNEATQSLSRVGITASTPEEPQLHRDENEAREPAESSGVSPHRTKSSDSRDTDVEPLPVESADEVAVQSTAPQTSEEICEEDEVVLDVRLLWKHFVKHFTQTFHKYIRSDFNEQRFLCREFWGQAMSLLLLEDRGAGAPALAAATHAAAQAARSRASGGNCSSPPVQSVSSKLAAHEGQENGCYSPRSPNSTSGMTPTVTSAEAIAAASVSAVSTLVKLLSPHFRVALRNPFTRFLPDLQNCQVLDRVHVTVWGAAALDRDTAARRIELPRVGKVLLVAACVAAYTPASRDKRTFNDAFGNVFRVLRPRRAPQSPLIIATARAKRDWNGDAIDALPRALPKTFTLTRWLALAECIGGESLALTRAGVHQQITTLLRLGAVRIASGSSADAGGGYGALGVLRLTEQSRGAEWTDPLGWVVQQQQHLLGAPYRGRGADSFAGSASVRPAGGDLGDLLNPNTRLALQAPLGLVKDTSDSLELNLGQLLTV